MDQPVPRVESDDVLRVLWREFGAAWPGAEQILAGYAGEEQDRVRMAVLRLAGGDLAELERMTLAARGDRRDVIACAESPGAMRATSWPRLPESERERIAREDWDGYRRWVQGGV